jgi:outer membrane protein OmpA-like peptidoglycan-associated protein
VERIAEPTGTGRAAALPVAQSVALVCGPVVTLLIASCGMTMAAQEVMVAPSVAPRLRPAPAGVADRMTRSAPDLRFDANSRLLKATERRKLAQAAPALESLLYDFPDLIIVIEGYSDDRGLLEYNDRLALERAEAVRRALLELSFPEQRLHAVGMGIRPGQCATDHAACRSRYRRVHFRAAQPALAQRMGGDAR